MKKSKKREEDILYIAVHGREQGRHRYVGYQYYTYIELDGQIATWIAIQFSSAFYVTGMCATRRSAQSPFLTPLQFYTHFSLNMAATEGSVGKVTLEELAQYTGKGGSRILMSINRTVYDVTSGASFCKPFPSPHFSFLHLTTLLFRIWMCVV